MTQEIFQKFATTGDDLMFFLRDLMSGGYVIDSVTAVNQFRCPEMNGRAINDYIIICSIKDK